MAVTREIIWQAADALDAEGIKPTLAAVRKRVGGGSFTTIQEAMTDWKVRQLQAAKPLHEPPPAELTERAATLAGEIWALARAAADTALAGERQRMAAEQAELQTQAAEAVELADTLTVEADQMKRELADLRAQQAEYVQVAAELATLKRETADAIQRATEHAAVKDSEASVARAAEKAALERAARAEGQVEALTGQLATLTAALRPAESANDS